MKNKNEPPSVYLTEGRHSSEPLYDLNYGYHPTYQSALLRGTDITPRPWDIYEIIDGKISMDSIVLDVGCGTANKSLPLARKAKMLVGIEPNKTMVEQARHNAALEGINNAQFVSGSFDSLSLASESVDMVVGFLAPHSVREIYRVLKPGGWAIIERVGDRDKVNIKKIFGDDSNGPRGQLMNVPTGSRFKKIKREFEEFFTYVDVRNGFWETEYTCPELRVLLENTPTIRNFSIDGDSQFIDLITSHHMTNGKIRTTQNRILATVKK